MSGFSSSGMANRARATTPANAPGCLTSQGPVKSTLGHASPAGSTPRNALKACLATPRKSDNK